MSGFGSSPWLAMRLSPSLRAAYDQIGGRRYGYGLLAEAFDEDEAPVGVNGAPRPPNGAAGSSQADRDLADRFASLEQAIATLTETLAGRQGANGGPENTAPIPDWLREDGPPTSDGIQDVRLVSAAPDLDGDGVSDRDEVQDVNVVRAAPDLDRDGREDKYETDTAGSDAARVTSSIRLEGVNEARREAIHTVLERLQEPDSLPGQAAYQTLVTFTGESNASLLRTAVSQHTAGAVQEASAATGDLVAQYRAQQMSDADILATFQSGTATSALREALSAQGEATPLSDEQLTAVADMVLLPQRRLTRGELAVVIGEQVAAGATSDQAVAEAIGTPVSFGGQTGAIRGVMAGAEAMNLSPDDLTRLADLINEGLREAVQAELAGRGHRPELVRGFVSDLASLPGAMIVPQTVARRPQQSDEV
ncbi:MAG: hypothetical protein KDE28_12545, partial [Anaerolineales bacterium]|nr:hypothetical protein [Anaerolineales bacterium]